MRTLQVEVGWILLLCADKQSTLVPMRLGQQRWRVPSYLGRPQQCRSLSVVDMDGPAPGPRVAAHLNSRQGVSATTA